MPEGHTIHRLARDHQRDFAGQQVRVSSPQGRFDAGARQLDRKTVKSVEAKGKHLCYEFTGSKWLHIHLGLYGRFQPHSNPPPEPRGAVRLRVVADEKSFDLNGPSKCELIGKRQWIEIENRLGPDPLRNDDPECAWHRISKSRQPIGKLLIDQSVIAGVGNVYRSEVLFLMGIHPERPGNTISREEFGSLWKTLVQLLEIGVKHNRIIIADPKAVGKPRSRMNRLERLLIYKHRFCTRCAGPVTWWELGARKAYACPRCQV